MLEYKEFVNELMLNYSSNTGEVFNICNDYNDKSTYYGISWDGGGMTGGNCWGDDPHEYSGDKQPDFILDDLLTYFCPNLSFKAYSELIKHIVEFSKSHYEYYGNHNKQCYKVIPMHILYDFIKEHSDK